MAAKVDVVIENFRVGVMERLSLRSDSGFRMLKRVRRRSYILHVPPTIANLTGI